MNPRHSPPPGARGFLTRLALALCSLLFSPLAGIVVGALYWGSLERGLLIFNLLGLAGFAGITHPFWRGERQKKRRLQLIFSGGSVLLSTLFSTLFDHTAAAYALYFAVACESFSLIPWIVEVLQEIRRGVWGDPAAPAARQDPPRPAADPMGPELPVPPPPWRLLLPVLLAAVLAAGAWVWQSGVLAGLRYPAPERIAAALEERYGEPFIISELYYEAKDLRTWQASPQADPELIFTVATGPAAAGEDASGLSAWGAVGEDNYRQHAWNRRVTPVFAAYGMAEIPLSISPEEERRGAAGGLLLPEPFASDFPEVYTGSTLIGWYMLPAAYWSMEEDSRPGDARRIAALLADLRDTAPFAALGSCREGVDGDLMSLTWSDWILPVAVNGGFVGFPIDQEYTPRQIQSALNQAHPYVYYQVEDGMISRPVSFAPVTPVPLH